MNKIKNRICVSLSGLIFLLCTSFFNTESEGWELKKNENGIAVYTRLRSGSDFKDVRVVNTVTSSLAGIVALMLDTKNYTNWIYACRESNTLEVISAKEIINYQVTEVPWPFSDRDLISHFIIDQDTTSGIITIKKNGLPDYIPLKDQRVRLKNFRSMYRFTPLHDNQVLVELEYYIDPSGNIPAWLINSSIVEGPYQTTVGMIHQLPKYQSVSYAFIKESK
jgi:hypothetical protein